MHTHTYKHIVACVNYNSLIPGKISRPKQGRDKAEQSRNKAEIRTSSMLRTITIIVAMEHIHTPTHTYTHAPTYTHTYTYTPIHTPTYKHTHLHLHTYTHTCTHAPTHTPIHIHLHF